MAYQALYRKYRPKTFSQVVGQEAITETLKNELAAGKISHAYLFTGTRGTGKTSCAKILARAVNCEHPENGEPCGQCELCVAAAADELTDIMEIDAASNNGVDSIRELRDQVNFSPAVGKYRVYIIDEVHMLSISAFNALLKTLEEPPAHVIFILATTEVHKLPATILSRCQRFDFKRVDAAKITEHIKKIAGEEGFGITEDAATLIAAAADGGMRDALSILDLCAAASPQIDEETVATVCAMAGNETLIKLADCIRTQDAERAMLLLDECHNDSVDMLRLLSDLTHHYRNLMITKTVRTKQKPIVCSAAQMAAIEQQAAQYSLGEILAVLDTLQESAARMQTGDRRAEMEMTVLRLCNPKIAGDLRALERRIAALEAGSVPTKAAKPAPEPPEAPAAFEPESDPESVPAPPAEKAPAATIAAPAGEERAVEEWDEILAILRTTCPLIAGVLNDSAAYIRGDYLLIDTANEQFRTMINGGNRTYRDHIRAAAEQVLGTSYKLGPYKTKSPAKSDDPLDGFSQKLKDFNI